MPIENLLAMGRQVLASQPFSVLLGAELLAFSAGHAELKVPLRAELKQQNGFAHGGMVSYAVDNALTFAGGSVLGPSVVTSEFKINYVRPAMGEFLVARATVVHAGKNQGVCRCEVYASDNGDETLCAIAQGTIASLGQSSAPRA
jgi:uncharacterized protein (TIGR00369 family)